MEHNHAVESKAVERYLLAEMSPEERDEFEDHYFSCMSCADDIRTASRFRDAVRVLGSDREAARERPAARPEPRRSWWTLPQLIPVGFAAALASVVIYMAGFEIPELRRIATASASVHPPAAILLREPVTLHETTRGEIPRIPRGGDSFGLFFDVPKATPGTIYDCQITTADGKPAATVPDFSVKPDGTAAVELLRTYFPEGSYTINVRKGDTVISQLNFIVE